MADEFQTGRGLGVKNQAQLIVKAFGLQAIKPLFFNVAVNDDEVNERGLGDLGKDASQFGLSVFDILDFDSVSYTTLEGDFITVSALSMATVLVDVSQSKNVVKTPVSGRNGTVKEYVSDGDYIVNIKGVLVGDGIDVLPDGLKNDLIGFCKAPKPINIASPLLASHGIYTIVIDSYNFPQLEGQRNLVPFELICLSETPFEISQQNAENV